VDLNLFALHDGSSHSEVFEVGERQFLTDSAFT
jgi:hypothetical protein